MIKEFFRRLQSRRGGFRILETQGVFIPQYYTFDWEGIDVELDTCWYNSETQVSRCSFKTFDQANRRLQKYLVTVEEEKKNFEKCKIHIVEKDPSFWTILKNGDNKNE